MQKASQHIQLLATCAVLAIFASAAVTNALNCYACSYMEGYNDTNCLKNVSALRALNCSKKYCITVRQEALHNASKVISFLRDCQDKPLILNDVRTDASFRTYHRSCQHDLCNNHDGRSYVNGSGNSSSGSATAGNHNGIVPGKNDGFRCRSQSWALAAAVTVTLLPLIYPCI